MANLSRIARPYAQAAFEIAKEQEALTSWESFLNAAAFVTNETLVMKLLENPQVSSDKLLGFFKDILSHQLSLNNEQMNFLKLLADNHRFIALPQIADRFSAFYRALQKMSHVRLITAVETDKAFLQKLSQSLSKRIERQVTVQSEIDPSLIGGAVIHIGDRVIDGSVRGKLNRLLQSLLS